MGITTTHGSMKHLQFSANRARKRLLITTSKRDGSESTLIQIGKYSYFVALVCTATSFRLCSVLKSGIPKPSSVDLIDEGYTSRVHLKDVSRAIIASMKDTGLNGGICNLSDSLPTPRSLVMKHAGELMLNHNITVTGRKIEDSGISERKSRRNKDRKRVSNEKMKAILKDEGGLLFPSYFEGLREVLSINIDQWKTID